jgi:hypothetical protein
MKRYRRSSGTRTGLDYFLHWTWIRRRTAELDIEAFDKGVRIKAWTMSRSFDGARQGMRVNGERLQHYKSGYLLLEAGRTPVWRERRTKRVFTLTAPCTFVGEGREGPLMIEFDLNVAGEPHHLRVLKRDVPLVRHALQAASAVGG